MDETKKGTLHASIARAADFYGPKSEKSFLGILLFDRLSKGKSAQLMTSANKVHSFTYVPDTGKALYMLAKNDSSFNQIWHMPTAAPPLTGKQWVEKVAAAFSVKPSYTVLSKFMLEWWGYLTAMFTKPLKCFISLRTTTFLILRNLKRLSE